MQTDQYNIPDGLDDRLSIDIGLIDILFCQNFFISLLEVELIIIVSEKVVLLNKTSYLKLFSVFDEDHWFTPVSKVQCFWIDYFGNPIVFKIFLDLLHQVLIGLLHKQNIQIKMF